MWTHSKANIKGCTLICCVKIAGVLVDDEAWTIGRVPM